LVLLNAWKLVVAMMKASRSGNATHAIPSTSEMLRIVHRAMKKRALGSPIVQAVESA
jgi:hypothetical protein